MFILQNSELVEKLDKYHLSDIAIFHPDAAKYIFESNLQEKIDKLTKFHIATKSNSTTAILILERYSAIFKST